MNRVLIILSVAFLVACPPAPPPQPPDPPWLDADAYPPPEPFVPPEAGPKPRDASPTPAPDASFTLGPCPEACSIFNWLGCPEGLTTPGGRTCVDVCQSTLAFGNGLSLPTACVVRARSIDDVRKCGAGPSAVRCGKK